jgi:dTDP-4-dehydrorhamnose 3,5-epimerase
MDIVSTTIPDVLIIQPSVYSDTRGSFFEFYNSSKYKSLGITQDFIQDNVSKSRQGTIKGLHYQVAKPQGKLIQVLRGRIYDVAVDLRQSSSSFGTWTGNYLLASENKQLWIPPGFAHGYYVISKEAFVFYKVTAYYAPFSERVIRWDDSYLKIGWPLLKSIPLIISKRDAKGLYFSTAEKYQ